jgi:hypothetical protein
MNSQNLLSILKHELIDYYESLKFEIDIKVQLILNQTPSSSSSSTPDDSQTKLMIIEENQYLIQQIDRVCDSNLIDINSYIQNEHHQTKLFVDAPNQKENIKREALKSYLIRIDHEDYETFGLYLEFDWYVNKKQADFIEY